MSLVAYDNSDSSEYEDDQDNSNVTSEKSVEVDMRVQPSTSETLIHHESEVNGNLFNALPQPSDKMSRFIEEEDEFLHKKETSNNILKQKSKISVPSLSDFKDVESTVLSTKARVINGKKSGLLSMLPQPRNGSTSVTIKSLIPHVLTQKSDNRGISGSVRKDEQLTTTVRNVKEETNKLTKDYSDDSDDDDVQNDFFSINKPVQIDEIPFDIQENVKGLSKTSVIKEPRSIESYFKKDVENHAQPVSGFSEVDVTDMESPVSDNVPNSSCEDNVVLDEEAILKLVGARGKRKREEIKIVDFNQQEVLSEARELLLKGLMEDTSKRVSASKKRGNEPTHMQKRKHQITYLAHQAKANEVELQNKWANNRLSKRQTQSKYGF